LEVSYRERSMNSKKARVLSFQRDPYKIKVTLFVNSGQLMLEQECDLYSDSYYSRVSLHGKEIDELMNFLNRNLP